MLPLSIQTSATAAYSCSAGFVKQMSVATSGIGNDAGKGCGLARALSKLGYCSRNQGWALIQSGRVKVDGVVRINPEHRVFRGKSSIAVDGKLIGEVEKVYLMLNKPRGLVTTASDEKARPTVYTCFAGHSLPPVMPVGRLDMASEGLLLFSNDTQWAARITAPEQHVIKVYHAQVGRVVDDELLRAIRSGAQSGPDFLGSKQVAVLRQGTRTSWLEIKLDEGKNRHIRRLLEAFGLEVLRLVRVAIGGLQLGTLNKGQFRRLTPGEIEALSDQ